MTGERLPEDLESEVVERNPSGVVCLWCKAGEVQLPEDAYENEVVRCDNEYCRAEYVLIDPEAVYLEPLPFNLRGLV